MPAPLIGPGVKRDGVLAHIVLFMLEITDFICLFMEPFFKVKFYCNISVMNILNEG